MDEQWEKNDTVFDIDVTGKEIRSKQEKYSKWVI